MGSVEGTVELWRIRRSLKKSQIRLKLLEHLYESYPESVGLPELCKAAGSEKTNVLGALVGYKTRYTRESSLVGMGLAECTEVSSDHRLAQMFSITRQGMYIYDSLYMIDFDFSLLSALKRQRLG